MPDGELTFTQVIPHLGGKRLLVLERAKELPALFPGAEYIISKLGTTSGSRRFGPRFVIFHVRRRGWRESYHKVPVASWAREPRHPWMQGDTEWIWYNGVIAKLYFGAQLIEVYDFAATEANSA